jgi:hypothetical protein
MLEMLAQSTGWPTETNISERLWEHFPDGKEIAEFVQCWTDEVAIAKATRGSFSEPIGELLEEINSTNAHLGQFFTPMSVVTMMTMMQINDLPKKGWLNGMDPCCGTGRFMLASLVHTDNLMMGACDLDLWCLRAAMVNARLLRKYTNRYYADPDDSIQPFTEKSSKKLRREGVLPPAVDSGLTVIGGRARFIHGDALRVDLTYPFNWREHSYKWSPFNWESLKMSAESEAEFYERVINPIMEKLGHSPPKSEGNVRFDYSMTDKPKAERRKEKHEHASNQEALYEASSP